jgi:hypothetical protein
MCGSVGVRGGTRWTEPRRSLQSDGVRVEIDQVIQTATSVTAGRLSPREAVTILATMTREATSAARELRDTDPDQARAYHELIVAIGRELRHRERDAADARHIRAVTDDLARLVRALEPAAG